VKKLNLHKDTKGKIHEKLKTAARKLENRGKKKIQKEKRQNKTIPQ
jgi:hypothetical protein